MLKSMFANLDKFKRLLEAFNRCTARISRTGRRLELLNEIANRSCGPGPSNKSNTLCPDR